MIIISLMMAHSFFSFFQVFHSGIPITLIPLDATNTILVTKNFYKMFEESQNTYEAQYCFKSLKMARDTWLNDQFYAVFTLMCLLSNCIHRFVRNLPCNFTMYEQVGVYFGRAISCGIPSHLV